MKRLLKLTLMLFLAASSASAFDGNRKGFVLGGRAGFSPSIKWKVSGVEESRIGGTFGWFYGYSWNEKNMITFDFNAIIYKFSSQVSNRGGWVFVTIDWHHYFSKKGSTPFIAIGRRGGNLIGGGYEFSDHLQVGIYYIFGEYFIDDRVEKRSAINLTIAMIAF